MSDLKATQARTELRALASKPANTSEARFRVLEAIDRYVRLTTERTTDIRKARNIVGTCPDMCPEKERYLREWKSMVPPYERHPLTNQMDHTKAIKQYSRSSADQELPLPHQLRTENALGSTMYFLLANLADRIDGPSEEQGAGNVSDWFHYIWDRTRGIRKDITQQDLCSLTVVELVQQCARFHIHCAARHVNEDPSIFDQKINTENLTKCLQTLKYMYADLKQQDIQCPNEAEFRAYMILLYLNEGSFQTELRGLPAAIIHSSEVKFAVSVHLALVHNDYVRFFKMVRQASYMNACILLRYFTQIRLTALKVIRKAYALRSTASFKLDYLANILGFDDEEDAVEFFEHFGVNVDRANGRVSFEVKHVAHDYQSYAAKRSLQLVESKRQCSVGEAICGVPLHDWGAQFSPVPCVSSFDEHGLLKRQILNEAFGRRDIQLEEEEQLASNQQQHNEELFGYREMEVEMEEVPPVIDDAVTNDGQQLNGGVGHQEMKIDQVTRNYQQRSSEELYGSSATVDDRGNESLMPVSEIYSPLQTDSDGQAVRTKSNPILSTAAWGNLHACSDGDINGANKQNIHVPMDRIMREEISLEPESNLTVDAFTPTAIPKADSGMALTESGSSSFQGTVKFPGFFSSNYTSNTDHGQKASQSDSTTTMAYVSPPASTQIARAGKKRTFFGAVKVGNPSAAPTTPSGATVESSSVFATAESDGSTATDGWKLEASPVSMFSYNNQDKDQEDQLTSNGPQEPRMRMHEADPSTIVNIKKVPSTMPESLSVTEIHPPAETDLQRASHKPSSLVWKRMSLSSPFSQAVTGIGSSVNDSGAELRLPCNFFDSVPKLQDRKQTWKVDPAGTEYHVLCTNTGTDEMGVENAESEVSDHDQFCERDMDNISEEVVSENSDENSTEIIDAEQALTTKWQDKHFKYVMKKYATIWLVNVHKKLKRCRMARHAPLDIAHKNLPPVARMGPLLRSRDRQPLQQTFENILTDPVLRRRLLLFETFPSCELIDPFGLLRDVMRKKFQHDFETLLSVQPLYWKLVISVPSVLNDNSRQDSRGFSSFLERWLSECSFARKSCQALPNNKHFFLEARPDPMFDCWARHNAICMRLVRGEQEPRDESERSPLGACKLANGVVIFMDWCTTLLSVRTRLVSFLSQCGNVQPAVVVLYYAPRDDDSSLHTIIARLNAALAFLDGFGISYKVFVWRDPSQNAVLRDALTFLAGLYCRHLRQVGATGKCLQMLPTPEYLRRCIGSELWYRFEMANRTLLAKPANTAEAIIQAYQTATFRMIDMVDKNHLKQFIRVPEDFDPVRKLWKQQVDTFGMAQQQLCEGYFAPNWQDQPLERLQKLISNLSLHPIPPELQDAINRAGQAATKFGVAIDTTELTQQLRSYLAKYGQHLPAATQSHLVDHLRLGIVMQLAGRSHRSFTEPPEETRSVYHARVLYWFPLLSSIATSLLHSLCTREDLPPEAYFVKGELAVHMNELWWGNECR